MFQSIWFVHHRYELKESTSEKAELQGEENEDNEKRGGSDQI